MDSWKAVLRADPTDWLLEPGDPSVRYFALTGLLGLPQDRPEVVSARQDIMQTGLVPRILSKQEAGGYWGVAEDFYMRSKYKGTVWSFLLLAELGADGGDERIRAACEFILEKSQDQQSGAFSYVGAKRGGGQHSKVVPCLTSNMVWALIRFGYLDDPRVRRGIEWITTYQRFDDGDAAPPKEWPYHHEACWGRHTCHMGVVKALKALSEIPEDKRSDDGRRTIEQGAEYMLRHHVHMRSHDPGRVAKSSWVKLGFPLMWQIDALDILLVLTRLGYHDPRMQTAVDLVISKQDDQGRWILENTLNGRMLVSVEQKGKPSKWVTLNALRALKGFCG